MAKSAQIAKQKKIFKAGRPNSGYPKAAFDRYKAGQPLGGAGHRIASRLRPNGVASGYHEPLPTNVAKIIRNAKTNFVTIGRRLVPIKGARQLERLADIGRTDTMSEAMRTANNKVVGHTHSGLKTSGQDKAHELLRVANSHIAELGTQEEKAVAYASLVVTARAPWDEVVQHFKKPKFTSHDDKKSYENARNEAKDRAQAGYDGLDAKKQKNVTAMMQRYATDLGRQNLIPNNRSTSPRRWTKDPYAPQSIGLNKKDNYTPEEFIKRSTSPFRR